jgi:hypothetical protein
MLKKRGSTDPKIEELYNKAYEILDMSLVKEKTGGSNTMKNARNRPRLEINTTSLDTSEYDKLNKTIVIFPETPKTPSGGKKLPNVNK